MYLTQNQANALQNYGHQPIGLNVKDVKSSQTENEGKQNEIGQIMQEKGIGYRDAKEFYLTKVEQEKTV